MFCMLGGIFAFRGLSYSVAGGEVVRFYIRKHCQFTGAKKSMQTFFVQSFSRTLRVMDVRAWTSAPKSAFSCGSGGVEKLFDPWASGRKGQECPREIRTKKFMFMLFFFPEFSYVTAIAENSRRISEGNSFL